MNRFAKSLRFKVAFLVIAVELLILTGVGVYYTYRFSQEVDNTIIARLSIPGLLMSRGELSFEAVSDKRTMEGLLREPYTEGLVIGLDGQVYFASDPALLNKHLDEIGRLELPSADSPVASAAAPALIAPLKDDTGVYQTSLSPLYPDGKLTGYLYLKVGTETSETEKRDIAILFTLGSLGTILLTAAILSWLLNLGVIQRLNNLVGIFDRFSQGDYAARAQPLGSSDEIATLMTGFNELAQRLEDTLAHLRNSETLLNNSQRISKVGGWEVDLSSGKIFWTQELYRIHELPVDPSIDHIKESMACYRPEDRPIISDAFQRACEKGETYDHEFPFTTSKGKPLWIRTTAQPIHEEGKVVRVIGNLMDITDQKHTEEALRLSSERLQLATRVANIGIWDWDVVNNELLWDDSMYQLYGIKREDFGGAYDAWAQTIYPEDRAYAEGEIQAALHGEREYEPEFRIVRPDGSIRYIKANSKTILDHDGKPLRMIGTNVDITERKQAEISIRTLNQELEQRVAVRTAQLEEANRELEDFSYSVSHDLRIPLRAIDGFSHILLQDYAGMLDDEGKRILKVVCHNTSRMGNLIDDILEFLRIYRLEVTFSTIDMEELARSALEEIRPAGGKLQVEIEHLPPCAGDRAMLRQVFVNLLSNAIKFSRGRELPKIKVGAKVNDGETIFFIQDNGVGFSMQYVDKLFGVFQRLHSVEEFEGTGIGLAIVKRIIVRHGGRVWAESRINEGATFYFSLPNREKSHE